MTGAGKKPTQAWASKHGVEYAYAYDRAGALQRSLAVRAIPHAILVAPSGRIVWDGHPAKLTAQIIEEHLQGTLAKPLWAWPPLAKSAAKALSRGKLGAALKQAQKVAQESEDLAEIPAMIEALIAGEVAALETALEGEDFLTALNLSKELKKSLAGLPQSARIAALAKKLAANRDAKKIARAQGQVRALRETVVRRRKDAQEVIAKLEKLRAKNPANAAGRDAAAALESFRALLDRLRF